ncbi:TRAP transporter large permease subunit [Candidatus Accumulibacter phosphatis]|uniref:TRAP transporter large permease subunit n=1 Tax=Candidatus Accumulibacter phosphatis TaxID=327160 RepID=UPI003C6C1360
MNSLFLFVMVLVLLFIGVPVGVALGLSSILFVAFFSHDSLSSVAIQLFGAGQNYTLLAIPFFHPGLGVHVDRGGGGSD